MVRKYTRKFRNLRNGKRFMPYFSYTQDDLNKALTDVKSKRLSTREAEEKYGVPKSTINRHLKDNLLYSRPGHPTLFSEVEEKIFVEYVKHMGEWGFPLDLMDLRVFAQKYLQRIGRNVYNLKDNLPGRDWAACFLQRHKEQLSNRYAANIASDRATLSSEVLDTFFDHYEQNVLDVTPDCVVNYDETNLTDDPGSKKYIFKRGKKYPERIINNSKTSVSLMFSGTASGLLLPVYVVYKAEHLYDTWLIGGPEHTRYNKSKSGWFDSLCFEDWFQTVIIPYVKTKAGKRVVLIGDNLSSHFSSKVLEDCEKFNITFVCLPPKATHILQPLDVAFFAPMKHYWRIILTNWKKSDGRKFKTLAKNSFPGLLSELLKMLHAEDAASQNLKSGFAKCGLLPVDRNRPKERLPGQISDVDLVQNRASGVVIEMLEEIRGCTGETKSTRKKRCNVPAGQSITLADLNTEERINKEKGKGKGKKTRSVTPKTTILPMTENFTQLSSELQDQQKLSNKGKGKGKENHTPSETEKDLEVSTVNTQTKNTQPYEIVITKHATPKKITERKKWRLHSETSSSDSDIELSVHSDSDILDVSDDDKTETPKTPFRQEVLSPETVSATLTLKEAVHSPSPVPGPSKETGMVDCVPVVYNVGDSVLVRYVLKKKVQYFVGHILSKSGEKKYDISFLKKTGRSDSTKFIKTKKVDIDTVHDDMIVKPIELLALNEKNTEFVFMNDEDIFFFEY